MHSHPTFLSVLRGFAGPSSVVSKPGLTVPGGVEGPGGAPSAAYFNERTQDVEGELRS